MCEKQLIDVILDYVQYDYRVVRATKQDNTIELAYSMIGDGTMLSDQFITAMKAYAPNRDYRLKMIPSEMKLVFELLPQGCGIGEALAQA